jgi:hypothetical protein
MTNAEDITIHKVSETSDGTPIYGANFDSWEDTPMERAELAWSCASLDATSIAEQAASDADSDSDPVPIDPLSEEFLEILNKHRVEYRLAPLSIDEHLFIEARAEAGQRFGDEDGIPVSKLLELLNESRTNLNLPVWTVEDVKDRWDEIRADRVL